MYIYIYLFTYVCIHFWDIFMYLYIHICIYIHMYIYTYVYVYTHIYMCIYVHIYIYKICIHIYIYMCIKTNTSAQFEFEAHLQNRAWMHACAWKTERVHMRVPYEHFFSHSLFLHLFSRPAKRKTIARSTWWHTLSDRTFSNATWHTCTPKGTLIERGRNSSMQICVWGGYDE